MKTNMNELLSKMTEYFADPETDSFPVSREEWQSMVAESSKDSHIKQNTPWHIKQNTTCHYRALGCVSDCPSDKHCYVPQ